MSKFADKFEGAITTHRVKKVNCSLDDDVLRDSGNCVQDVLAHIQVNDHLVEDAVGKCGSDEINDILLTQE